MSKAFNITIDIISDTICPWCFVGKRRLERAMQQFKPLDKTNVTFTVNWHPFYLGPPDSPIVSKLDRYTEKFGAARVQQIIPHMKTVGEAEGINFDYGGPIGPTYLSHRVISFASKHHDAETVDATVEALFKSYFEHRGNIFTIPTLTEILRNANVKLDFEGLQAYLAAEDGRRQVDAEVAQAQRKGVHGVPDFTVAGKYNLNGAQDSTEFVRIFERVCKEGQSEAQL